MLLRFFVSEVNSSDLHKTNVMNWSVCFRMAKFVWFKPENSSSFYLLVAKFSVMNICICTYKKFNGKIEIKIFWVTHIFCIGLVSFLLTLASMDHGEGNGNPLQYSCLENPMDWEAWRATVHRVTELDTTEVT